MPNFTCSFERNWVDAVVKFLFSFLQEFNFINYVTKEND